MQLNSTVNAIEKISCQNPWRFSESVGICGLVAVLIHRRFQLPSWEPDGRQDKRACIGPQNRGPLLYSCRHLQMRTRTKNMKQRAKTPKDTKPCQCLKSKRSQLTLFRDTSRSFHLFFCLQTPGINLGEGLEIVHL